MRINTGAFLAIAVVLTTTQARSHDYLADAVAAGNWISAAGVDTDTGRAWPAEPDRSERVARDLYNGNGGVVLYLLDLYRATGNERWLAEALAGARELVREPTEAGGEPDGLYTGRAGRCFVLHRAGAVGGDAVLTRAAEECVARLVAAARAVGAGVEWNEVTDIVGGSAGIGLVLLWAHDTMAADGALAAAVAAGDRLLERAREADAGAKWPMSDEFPRLMPNFSHGTAGIAYFLARLYEVAGEERFLAGALAGARYLQSVADTEGQICRIFHHEPDGGELYYLSWCHGPAGTGRTFYQLYRVTGDMEWLEWTRRTARAILASGIPEQRTPGFWNNVGRCCGNAGVIDFFLDLHAAVGDPEYLPFAERMARDLVARGTRAGSTLSWVQAEHRVQPENLAAQTGYMQGAAGIGTTLLRLHSVRHGTPAPVALPDSPFGR